MMKSDHQELLRQDATKRYLKVLAIATITIGIGFVNVFVGMYFNYFYAALAALLTYVLGIHLGVRYGFAKGLITRIIVHECEEQEEAE